MRNISDLFKGRDDVHGYYGLLTSEVSERGKKTGKAKTVRAPVTSELWQLHLKGEQRLGIVPVIDGECWWFCIDVDHYQDEGMQQSIAARIKELDLPLVQTRSKSGGAHLWCFFSERMSAAVARTVATDMAKKLLLPAGHIDIFPRQENADDVGNWMNMPYFGDLCHCVGEDGEQDFNLQEFELYANERVTHPSDLARVKKSKKEAKGSKFPPCIDYLLKEGIPEGYRNDAMTQFAVVYKNAYPDDWKERVAEVNEDCCDPPLDKAEMRTILNSVAAKDIQYLCTKMQAIYCDKSACKKRVYGVGNGGGGGDGRDPRVPIDSMEKIDGETPVYRVTMYGKTFQIDMETLMNYKLFRVAAAKVTDQITPNMKADEWEDIAQAALDLMNVEKAATGTQMGERVLHNFKRFAEGAVVDDLTTAVTRGLPYYDAERSQIIFKGDDFMSLIDRSLKIDRDRTWLYMREFGTVQTEHTVEGEKAKYWTYVVSGPIWFDPSPGEKA